MTETGGKLEVILGPMFSGKTSELIRRIQRYHLANYRCLIVKYTLENKLCTSVAETKVITHDGKSLPAILAVTLKDLENVVNDFDVIGIDDGHLFSDINEFCKVESDNGKTVIVAGLDGSIDKKAFPQILSIIPLAEEVTKLTAICVSCASEAPYTKLVSDGQEGAEMGKYMSVCGNCYSLPHFVKRSPFKNFVSRSSQGQLS